MPVGRTSNAGFTLLEVLVVVLIIGITLTFATLSVRDDALPQEGQRVASLVELAGEEAMLHSRVIGIEATASGYRFMERREGKWQVIENDRLLRPRTLPDELALELLVDGLPAVGGPPADEAAPQVLLFPDGERTPFELVLRRRGDGSTLRISAGPVGHLTLAGRPLS